MPDSSPAGNVRLSAFRLNGLGEVEKVGSAETEGDDGAYKLVVPAGSNLYLRADSDGWQTPDTWLGDVGSFSLSTILHPVLGVTQSNLNIQILAGYEVAAWVKDQITMDNISNATVTAWDASSNLYAQSIYQWGAWSLLVPTNTPLTFFADAEGYAGEFMTNVYDFAEAGYAQHAQGNYFSLQFVLHSLTTDSDSDGLPDYREDTIPDNEAWAEDYSDFKRADSDSDGFSDLEEYVAGTDPRNYRSIFEVEKVASDSGFTLRWDSVPGREYRVMVSDDLPGGSWSNAYTVVASGSETSYEPAMTNSLNYYRVQILIP